jgi:F420H(2)-dependent quinone reductase
MERLFRPNTRKDVVVGLFQRFAAVANSVVQPLVLSPRWGRLVEGQMTVITYTGRRSGRKITTPVAYKKHGDEVTIGVQFPDQKQWWRNFADGESPISVRLRGVERNGKATAVRDSRGKVMVNIVLESDS